MAAQKTYWTACSVVLLANSIPNATSVNVRMSIGEMPVDANATKTTFRNQLHSPGPVANKMAKKQFQSVLILGSSVDRYALSTNFSQQTYFVKSERNEHSVVLHNVESGRQLGMAFLQHPGVGLRGDLDWPFWNKEYKTRRFLHSENNETRKPQGFSMDHKAWILTPTWQVIQHAPQFSKTAFGTDAPDLVVVESSLWDLAGWWENTGHLATPQRIRQWCDEDVPFLLKNVSAVFPQSRIVFRTAPTVAPSWASSNGKWTPENFKAMHDCIMRRSAGTGEIVKHVGVIDYYAIMDKLIASTDKDHLEALWKQDGYHPTALPGRLYLNEIFKLLGVQPMEAPDTSRRFLREGETFLEDEDDF